MADTRQQIRDIMRGNRQAFAVLVDDHKRLVSQIVHRVLPGDADHEDLCQDVFLKVYENLGKFQHKSKLSTWIARIAYNTCLNFVEKKRAVLYDDTAPEGESLDTRVGGDATPEEETESRQRAVQVCEEIDKLPVQYGLILSLYHLQDMSYAEIAEIMDMPDGTVKSYLFRARRMLKERLADRFAEEELCA